MENAVVRSVVLTSALVVLLSATACDRADRLPAPTGPQPILAPEGTEEFAGSSSCRDCHERFYELWSTSHHGTAMQPFTTELAAEAFDFPSRAFRIGDFIYRAELDGEMGRIRAVGPDGEQRYPIKHVMGGKNVFFLLTVMKGGRLQVLPLAFDVGTRDWYDTTASMVRHYGHMEDEAIEWTDWRFTFNTSCHSCHVSQLATNFDPRSGTYNTEWAEPGINCETCHGPAAEHVELFRGMAERQETVDPRIISTSAFTVDQNNDTCAPCHAKMVPLTDAFTPGDRFFDHFDITAFEHADFYPDGRDLGENFTYTLWLTSPCAQSGQLSCLHCHTSSGRYRFADEQPNGACLPCHEERVADAAAHTHHEPDGPAGRCIACHMPSTEFARMRRSDHSMRPPTPAVSFAIGSPNACNSCHTDQDAHWADERVREWRERDYQYPILHRAGLIHAARQQDWTRLPQMLAYITSDDRDPVFAASLIRLLRSCRDQTKWPALIEALSDPSPLIRSAAAAGLEGQSGPISVAALLTATEDDFRVVRVQAALALAAYPRELLSPADQGRLQRASDEYIAMQRVRPDIWSTHYNLGNYWMNRGDFEQSVRELETALDLHPENALPWNNLAVVFARMDDHTSAAEALRRSLQIDPDSEATNFNLALLLAEQGDHTRAEQYLRRALASNPQFARAAYNLCVLLDGMARDEALEWCRTAATIRPDNPYYSWVLARYLRDHGYLDGAITVLVGAVERHPMHVESTLLLGEIYAASERADDALAVYRRALEQDGLDVGERESIESRIQALTSE